MGREPKEAKRKRKRREFRANLKKGHYIVVESTEAQADVVITAKSVVPLRIEKGRRK